MNQLIEQPVAEFPPELLTRQQWLIWRFVQKPGQKKPSKMPYYASGAIRTGVQGSDEDRSALVNYEAAVASMEFHNADGLGCAFLPNDGLIGIDIDGALNDDVPAERRDRAQRIIEACASYTEYSPSMNGVHIIATGHTETFKSNELGIEVFCGRQFFTMSGNPYPGTQHAIAALSDDTLRRLRDTVKTHAVQPPSKPHQQPASSDRTKLESALVFIHADCGYEDWIRVGMAIHAELGDSGLAIWDWWSARGSKYPGQREVESHFRSFKPGSVTGGTLYRMAMDAGWRPPKPVQVQAPAQQPERIDPETGEILDDPVQLAAANDNAPEPMDLFAEFPVPAITRDMLPKAIADYAFDSGELIGVDPAMIAMPALVSCAAALHDAVKIQPKRHETGWTESARLWCAVVGSPSVKKSPAIKRATKRLRKIDMELHEDNAKDMARHLGEMEAYKDAKKEAKKTGEQVTAPEPAQNNRMVVEDITVEALSEILKCNSRGVLCIQDELSGWFGAMDAYSGGKAGGKDRAHWLEAYNGGGRVVDRVMRGNIHIPNWSVSMIGGIQPDAIRRIAANMTDDGLMQRFMIIVGGNAREHDRPEDSEAGANFAQLVDHLYVITGSDRPVTLSEEAHQVREKLNAYSTELTEFAALPGGLRSHLGKWSGLFARLLLTFHAIECHTQRKHPVMAEVSGETAQQVDQLMRRYLLPHAMAYYTDILGAATDLEHARWVAGHILAKNMQVITNREIMQAYKQWRGLDDWRRARIMQTLEDMGWLVPMDGERQSRKGTNTWAVVMKVHGKFSAKAATEAEKRERIRQEYVAMQAGR